VRRYTAGSNVVRLDADVAAASPDASSVNQALRLLMRLARSTSRSSRPRDKSKKR